MHVNSNWIHSVYLPTYLFCRLENVPKGFQAEKPTQIANYPPDQPYIRSRWGSVATWICLLMGGASLLRWWLSASTLGDTTPAYQVLGQEVGRNGVNYNDIFSFANSPKKPRTTPNYGLGLSAPAGERFSLYQLLFARCERELVSILTLRARNWPLYALLLRNLQAINSITASC